MKLKPINEKIGTWVCGAGGVAEVFQTKKPGRHFYTRCKCCGLNQGTGAARQQRIYDEAVFIDKSAIVIPSGVSVGASLDHEMVGHEETKPQSSPVDEVKNWTPDELESEPVHVEQKSVLAKLAPFLIVAAAVGVGIWQG